MTPVAQDMLTARQMLREGFGLADIAEEIGWQPADIDLALWRYLGRRDEWPKSSRTPAFLAGRR